MPLATLHRWQRVGWIHSRKADDGSNRWVIYADLAELDRLRRLRVTPRGWPQTFPQELITPGPIPEALQALYESRTTSIQPSSSEAV